MRGQEAQAVDPVYAVEAAQQIGEGGVVRQVYAVAIDDLTEQRNLANAAGRQCPDLGFDRLQRPAALNPTAEGDDAEGTRVRAAEDNRNVRCHLLPAPAFWQRPFAIQKVVALPDGRLKCRPAIGAPEVLDQRTRIRRRGEHIDVRESALQCGIPLHSHQAAHQVDHHLGTARLERTQSRQPAVRLVLCALPDDAGVQDDHVGLLGGGRGRVAQSLERRRHALRVGHVHLAAGSPHQVLHRPHYNWADFSLRRRAACCMIGGRCQRPREQPACKPHEPQPSQPRAEALPLCCIGLPVGPRSIWLRAGGDADRAALRRPP